MYQLWLFCKEAAGESERGRKRTKKKRTDLILLFAQTLVCISSRFQKIRCGIVGVGSSSQKKKSNCKSHMSKKKKIQGQNFGGGSEILLQLITSVT